MDKYELIEILRAAADGIAGASKSKEAELKLEGFRRIVYNFCKFAVSQEKEFSAPALTLSNPFGNSTILDKFYSCVSNFDQAAAQSKFYGHELLFKVNDLYKQLTNEDPPKEE